MSEFHCELRCSNKKMSMGFGESVASSDCPSQGLANLFCRGLDSTLSADSKRLSLVVVVDHVVSAAPVATGDIMGRVVPPNPYAEVLTSRTPEWDYIWT